MATDSGRYLSDVHILSHMAQLDIAYKGFFKQIIMFDMPTVDLSPISSQFEVKQSQFYPNKARLNEL